MNYFKKKLSRSTLIITLIISGCGDSESSLSHNTDTDNVRLKNSLTIPLFKNDNDTILSKTKKFNVREKLWLEKKGYKSFSDTLEYCAFQIKYNSTILYDLGLAKNSKGNFGYRVCCDTICNYHFESYSILQDKNCSWGGPESNQFGIYFSDSVRENSISLIPIDNEFNFGLIELYFDSLKVNLTEIKLISNEL